MSVFHILQIAPKSNTIISLEDIKTFISNLSDNGLIEKEFTILTGEKDPIQKISFWDFKNESIKSELNKDAKLEIAAENDIENLSPEKNYAFKIHLTKTSEVFENLEVFKASQRTHFPLFVLYFENPIDFEIDNEDEETEEFEQISLTNINCVLKSSGRNMDSLFGLAEYQEEFEVFFDLVNQFIGDFEMGTYYE